MPVDWLEEEPETIPDPDAEKPEEWDVSDFRAITQTSSAVHALRASANGLRTRKTETGSHLWFPTQNARTLQDAVHGLAPRSGIQSTRSVSAVPSTTASKLTSECRALGPDP